MLVENAEVEHCFIERDGQRLLRAEVNRVGELLVLGDADDVEDPDADAIARDAEPDALLRKLVACEEALERLAERFRIAKLSTDDDSGRERLAGELLHLGDAVVRDARGGELRRPDLQADELLDRVTALPAPLPPPDERVGSDGIGNDSFFQKGSCGPAGTGAGDTAAVPAGAPAFLPPNDTCFFQKGTFGAAGATSTGRAAVGAFASAASTDASSAGDRALLLRPSETCFFQNGVEAAFSLFSFDARFGLRRLRRLRLAGERELLLPEGPRRSRFGERRQLGRGNGRMDHDCGRLGHGGQLGSGEPRLGGLDGRLGRPGLRLRRDSGGNGRNRLGRDRLNGDRLRRDRLVGRPARSTRRARDGGSYATGSRRDRLVRNGLGRERRNDAGGDRRRRRGGRLERDGSSAGGTGTLLEELSNAGG